MKHIQTIGLALAVGTTQVALAALVACNGIAGEEAALGQADQAILGFDPQFKKGVYLEPGIFHGADGSTMPFSAYVVWEGDNFAAMGAFGSLETDLGLPDSPVFPAANPSAPVLYEYAEDSTCIGIHARECVATEHVSFTVPGAPDLVQGLSWTLARHHQADPIDSAAFDQAEFVFSSIGEPGEGVDAFNYRVRGAECVAAVNRIKAFYAGRGVVFSELKLKPAQLCN